MRVVSSSPLKTISIRPSPRRTGDARVARGRGQAGEAEHRSERTPQACRRSAYRSWVADCFVPSLRRAHLASWPYAFAMAGGGHGGSQHPALPVVRDETTRLHVRCRHVEARLAELT